MSKKLTNLNRHILVITNIDEKWFVIFAHTINHLSFDYVRLPQLENHFSCLASFSFFFFFFSFLFLLRLFTFKPLNELYSNFEH